MLEFCNAAECSSSCSSRRHSTCTSQKLWTLTEIGDTVSTTNLSTLQTSYSCQHISAPQPGSMLGGLDAGAIC